MDVTLGFTGTGAGMTAAQTDEVRSLVNDGAVDEFHHGDCVGADEEAHDLAREAGKRIVVHPPDRNDKRAWCLGDVIKPTFPYLVRNHHIVDATDVLVAAPRGAEVVRSGTWATVRYARRQGHRIAIIQPDGTVMLEGPWT